MAPIRLLLYGDIDLNLIDGSSIWLAALAETLSGTEEIHVTILRKTPFQRDTVIQRLLRRSNVDFIDPWRPPFEEKEWGRTMKPLGRTPRLNSEVAANLVALVDRHDQPGLIIVRADSQTNAVAHALAGTSVETARKAWAYICNAAHLEAGQLADLHKNYRRLLCQTPQSRSLLREKLAISGEDKFLMLPPMIPACPGRPPLTQGERAVRLCYSGKFSPPYFINETLNAFDALRREDPSYEFHLIGDKFLNRPPVPDYEVDLAKRLRSAPGVVWHGGLPHSETQEIIAQCHVAASWRDETFDDSLELSTKVLEYAALGLPVLMNPSKVQVDLFGEDYPLYVATEDQFLNRMRRLSSEPDLYARVSKRVTDAARDFTYSRALERLAPAVQEDAERAAPRASLSEKGLKILFAGHDLKFIQNFIRQFSALPGCEVNVDQWDGHAIHTERISKRLLRWADVIYCEWCLGNALWYSQNLLPDQRLIIRVHHQEMLLPYRHDLNWRNVHAIVFTNFTHYNAFKREQPEHAGKAVPIFCDVDCGRLARPKVDLAQFNLGLVGINPMRKRPEIAVEILRCVRRSDPRFSLVFKSRMPWEYEWLWRRPDEKTFYSHFFKEIDGGPDRNAIAFDGHGDDMASWYSKVGFILSTSDHEGSHQAVAEGMASGCVPVIRNWEGASPLYPPRFVFDDVHEAAKLILSMPDSASYEKASAECMEYARRYFDGPVIVEQIERLFRGADPQDDCFFARKLEPPESP